MLIVTLYPLYEEGLTSLSKNSSLLFDLIFKQSLLSNSKHISSVMTDSLVYDNFDLLIEITDCGGGGAN